MPGQSYKFVFKDADGAIKRQAARFRVFVYDDCSPDGRELAIGDTVQVLNQNSGQLLTGTLPFRSESMAKLMYAIANEPAPDLRTLRPEIPEALARLVRRSVLAGSRSAWPGRSLARRGPSRRRRR